MATTWSSTGNRSAKATCTSGTESAPSGATPGVNLTGCKGVNVVVTADTTLSGAGTLKAYVYDADTFNAWVPCPDLDLSVTASSVKGQGFAGIYVPGPRGRVAWVPSGVTYTGTNLYVWINAVSFDERAV